MKFVQFDYDEAFLTSDLASLGLTKPPSRRAGHRVKRGFDVVTAVIALAVTSWVAVLLLLVNPVLNPGPLFYSQLRMGLGGRPFVIWKFRTMTELGVDQKTRHPHAELEHHRVTPFGRLLRRSRIDELPNFINVLKGEMSVVGPRPDTWEHAVHFLQTVPYYRNRLQVLPGITGLAQVRVGYADHHRAIHRKARYDHVYVRTASPQLALYVVWQTVLVMVSGRGAK